MSEVVTHTIEPVFDASSRVLVLGTMPSPASREVGFYYGHPQNRFWRVMERLFGLEDHTLLDNDARTAFLLERHIALWDVLASCAIEGASDASISDPVPNDLTRILDAAPIERVICTGGTAERLCRRFNGKLLHERGIDLVGLPSTSPANARMRLDDLVAAYAPAFTPLRQAHLLQHDKQAIRAAALSARDAIDPGERTRRSAEICTQLTCELGRLASPATVAVYAAMRSEVNLDEFVRAAYGRGCRVAFPCMQRAADGRQTMVMRAVTEDDHLAGNVPFINRPVASFVPTGPDAQRFPLVAPQDIDLAAVPLVAYDDSGNRLGYGGGNYDRYLPQLRTNCIVAGVAFEAQRVPEVPIEPHDRPLLRIISA